MPQQRMQGLEPNQTQPQQIGLECLELLLNPIASFCVRFGLPLSEIIDCLKRCLVRAAQTTLERNSAKITASRVSLLTGVHRNDVARFLSGEHSLTSQFGRIDERVLQRWLSDPRFADRNGGGRPLTCKGVKSEFHALVSSISKNINPATVKFELVRTGRAELSESLLVLTRPVIQVGDNMPKAFELVSSDVDSLLRAVEQNLQARESIGHMHFHTTYDNISTKEASNLRRWLIDKGRQFHQEVRAYLAGFDRDINPDLDDDSPQGTKISIVSFSFTDEPQ